MSVRVAESRDDWAAKARKLEDLGYSTLSVPDHLAEMIAPMPALAAAAAVTTRLRIGTMVLNNDLRHPVLVAREAATLDVVSGGRFELGLGAGHMKSEYDQAGLRFDAGATRVERLAESVVVTDDRRGAASELAARWPVLRAEDLLASPYVLLGTVDQLVDDLRERRDRWSISSYTIFEPYVDAFAPVVARLAGS